MTQRSKTMKGSIKTVLLSALAAAAFTGSASAQSTPDDPLGINVTEDPTIQQQRGGLTGGTNGGIAMPYGWRSNEKLDTWPNGDQNFLQDNGSGE
jgi:hypothetical protein